MMQKIFLTTPNNNDELLQKIDKLILKFCDTSIDCNSLESLHECTKKIFDEGYQLIDKYFVNSQHFKEELSFNIDQIHESFESYFMDLIYDVTFFKITQFLLSKDIKLSKVLEEIEYLDFSQIELPSSIKDGRKRVYAAISKFERIGSFRTPADKLNCLLNTISELTKEDDESKEEISFLDSDSLIPLLLMIVIRSRIPHLIANLVYIKEYNFSRNVKIGKDGYALSTLEGVLDYILDAQLELSNISRKNKSFWSAIKAGDITEIKNPYYNDTIEVRDINGNNGLMIACMYGQANIVDYLIHRSDYSQNDNNCTPLMCAIKCSNSLDSVRILLKHKMVKESINSLDYTGNSAILYAAGTNNLSLIKLLLKEVGIHRLYQVNSITYDSVLHIAAQNNSSLEFITYLMEQLDLSWRKSKNKKGETFYHLIQSLDLLKYVMIQPTFQLDDLVNDVDHMGRSPFMMWASKGRLDLIETLIPYIMMDTYSQVDKEGNTIFHLLATHLCEGLVMVFGENSLNYIVEQMKGIVNVRSWNYGNTPLHLIAGISTRAPKQNIVNAILFIKALVNNGAWINAVNFKGEHPVDICKVSELVTCMDGNR
ncbi:uncharacterized protein BX663DRAFT_183991 [Cokeromyces recurvatus]|uniref:uncharacterized protein n=1 Tax=Cokeromyces recurvatus TaxID=90255 RepID=UPI00221F1023|nr:uncharacterized protein BX663DRAFT_183991 [Cokeromyces recurvatus]KAI7899577.1 hypothetical protein BX663DRAFT_183991 [Cokeromyces recurvatus]